MEWASKAFSLLGPFLAEESFQLACLQGVPFLMAEVPPLGAPRRRRLWLGELRNQTTCKDRGRVSLTTMKEHLSTTSGEGPAQLQ